MSDSETPPENPDLARQSLEQIEEGDEDNVTVASPALRLAADDDYDDEKDHSFLDDDDPGVELSPRGTGGSALSTSPQPRLPSQAGRANLARTPGLGGEEAEDEYEDDEEEDAYSDDVEFQRPRSVLITEVKEDGVQVEWAGPKPPASDSEEEGKEEDREEDWDTDLELDDSLPEHDPSGRTFYAKVCDKFGVVPVSYFSRHITDPEIVMRYHGLGPHGTRAIARVLRQIVTCEKLNLAGNWMEWKGGMHIARTIMENDYISELILSDNQLGSVGAYHFAKMLENNASLRILDLAGNGFADTDAEYFAEALEQNKYLKGLNLSRNNFSTQAGRVLGPAIGSNDVLETLDLSWNQLRGSGAVAIARGIKENVRLKSVNLAWNGFGEDGGAALADALAQQESITDVDISGNRINGPAAFAIAKMLKSNEELKTLKLGNNPLTTAGAITLSKALRDCETSALVFLDITECPVEYEFMKIVQEIEQKRAEFRVSHGPILRSGNGPDDFGKPGVDPYKVTNPLLVLKEHIVVNDLRIIDKLKEFDTEEKLAVSQEQFAEALETLGVPFSKAELTEIAGKLDKNRDGTVYYGDILDQMDSAAAPPEAAGKNTTAKLSLTQRPITVE